MRRGWRGRLKGPGLLLLILYDVRGRPGVRQIGVYEEGVVCEEDVAYVKKNVVRKDGMRKAVVCSRKTHVRFMWR